MKAGILRDRICIEHKIKSQDPESGLITDSWQVFADKAPAQVYYLSAKEFITAQTEKSEITARITIRYRKGIHAQMRIVFDGKYFDIKGVLPDNKNGKTHLTILVSEGVNHG